ncbi:hypothetical protein GUJ93_ZPchr0013g37800 [Zizania palustris]|uniref:LOB domain-containing protein n=1 Tax=Zizania palustris TaxID=103762 RepID=A0A8J6C2C1_ZIZPA|nr:hypothetical protein GUJ93_ZPchr0013g37800 [Zizania palustris]KAG8097603.1 hypothetical protein GUJ93_ZPchr0013g37800 [Zizania palustris]
MSSSSSPCAACKLLRRKCTQGCVFAPYFPPDQPIKFSNVHKVFGASNVTKLLNDLPQEQREAAVNSLAYEAEARLRDPVYGCVAYISILQLRIKEAREQINEARKELAAYIGPRAFGPLVTAGSHPHYLPAATADGQHYHHGMAVPFAAGYMPQSQHHQLMALQAHPTHHQQQIIEAQQMAAAVEVARGHEMDRMVRMRQQAFYAANAATVAVEPTGSADQTAYDNGSFLHLQSSSSTQNKATMALPYRMEEPSPPPQSSSGDRRSHGELSHAQHHHHHDRHTDDEGMSGGASLAG